MLSRILLSSVIALLVSAGAFADIIQQQGYAIGTTTNGIELLQGLQNGQGSNTMVVNNDQSTATNGGTSAQQSQSGLLNQVGSAAGDVAVVSVGQIFHAFGGNTQPIGGLVNPMLLGQSLGLLGTQLVGTQLLGTQLVGTQLVGMTSGPSGLALLIGLMGARF